MNVLQNWMTVMQMLSARTLLDPLPVHVILDLKEMVEPVQVSKLKIDEVKVGKIKVI